MDETVTPDLAKAINTGNTQDIETLLRLGYFSFQRLWRIATRAGAWPVVRHFWLESTDVDKESALNFAIDNERMALITGLVQIIATIPEREYDPPGYMFAPENRRYVYLFNVISRTLAKGRPDLVTMLLEAGQEAIQNVLRHATAFPMGTGEPVVMFLLDSATGLDLNSVIASASRKLSTNAVRRMLDMGADVNAEESKPLIGALANRTYKLNLEMVTLLLDRGADPSLQNKLALEYAAAYPDHAIFRRILAATGGIGQVDNSKRERLLAQTSLVVANPQNMEYLLRSMRAYNWGNPQLLQRVLTTMMDHYLGQFPAPPENMPEVWPKTNMLLEHPFMEQADPDVVYKVVQFLLEFAAAQPGHLALVQYLMSKGAHPAENFSTAVRNAAVKAQDTAMVQKLLSPDNHLPASMTDVLGNLHSADETNKAIARMLLAKGADPSVAVAHAILFDNVEVARALFDEFGAQPPPSPLIDRLLALKARIDNNSDMIRLLVSHGARVNAFRGGILISAMANVQNAELLIDLGANVNAQKCYALARAIEFSYTDMIRMLIRRGADVNARNARSRKVDDYQQPENIMLNRLVADADDHESDDDEDAAMDEDPDDEDAAMDEAVTDGFRPYATRIPFIVQAVLPRSYDRPKHTEIKWRGDILRLIADAGADVRVWNDEALFIAAKSANLNAVRILLEKGAEPRAANHRAFRAACHTTMKTKSRIANTNLFKPDPLFGGKRWPAVLKDAFEVVALLMAYMCDLRVFLQEDLDEAYRYWFVRTLLVDHWDAVQSWNQRFHIDQLPVDTLDELLTPRGRALLQKFLIHAEVPYLNRDTFAEYAKMGYERF